MASKSAKGARKGKGRSSGAATNTQDDSTGFELAERVSRDGLVHANCFVGSEAVSWCAEHVSELNGSRLGATRLMKRFMRAGFIEHVAQQPIFEDVDDMLFCFCAQKSSEDVRKDMIQDHLKRMQQLKALQKTLEQELHEKQTRTF